MTNFTFDWFSIDFYNSVPQCEIGDNARNSLQRNALKDETKNYCVSFPSDDFSI